MAEPIWLAIARTLNGLKEVPGQGSNPVILQWAKDLGIDSIYKDDDIAWCALAMNRICLAARLPLTGKDYDLLRAASFLPPKWGQSIKEPALGCFQVFKRPAGHHVFLYLGERKDAYCGIGGNQSNAFNVTWIDKARLLGNVWPVGQPLPTGGRVQLASDGKPLSQNEA